MENPTQLPELVHKFLSYISRDDLISCTRVSSIWEFEARTHLLNLAPTTPLHCCTFDTYFATMRRTHSILHLSLCSSSNCLSIIVGKLLDTDSIAKVSSLATPWALDENWNSTFATWSLFDNLETLELTPYCEYNIDNETMATGRNPYRHGLLFPTIKILVWHQTAVIPATPTFLSRIIPILLQTMGNVTTLKFFNVTRPLLSGVLYNCEAFLPLAKAVSLFTEEEEVDHDNYFISSVFDLAPLHLSRLEFRPFTGSNASWEFILNNFEASLEHLTIRGGKNPSDKRVLSISPLPKLKVLEIFLASESTDCHETGDQGDLEMKFIIRKRKGYQSLSLDWECHFPSLTRLEVGREDNKLDGDGICAELLVKTFLHGKSESLRRLIIPRLDSRDCGAFTSSERAEFGQKVVTTFPNLDNLQFYKQFELDNAMSME